MGPPESTSCLHLVTLQSSKIELCFMAVREYRFSLLSLASESIFPGRLTNRSSENNNES
jgi:hypothetical protein